MKTLIKKSGLKIDGDREKIEAVLTEVNGTRARRWVAEYEDIRGVTEKAERTRGRRTFAECSRRCSSRLQGVLSRYGVIQVRGPHYPVSD